jgi:hypothetical protein
MKLTGENRRTRGKTCPNATLSTTNPTWTETGSNPGLRGGTPAANRLSHGAALQVKLQILETKCASALRKRKAGYIEMLYNGLPSTILDLLLGNTKRKSDELVCAFDCSLSI